MKIQSDFFVPVCSCSSAEILLLFRFVLFFWSQKQFCFVLFCFFGQIWNFVLFPFLFLEQRTNKNKRKTKKWKIELGNFLDYANLWHTFWPGFQIVHEIFSCNCARKFRSLKIFLCTKISFAENFFVHDFGRFFGSFQNFKNSLLGQRK